MKLLSHYVAASECGGDFWDAYIRGNKLTLAIGDATGHGAGAAIVTAVAKSAFSTLNAVYPVALLPEQFLYMLNKAIYRSTRGKLLLTMCIIQIDLATGQVLVSNAGHESPLFLPRSAKPGEAGKKGRAEALFARGERLGFVEEMKYTSHSYQMAPGDMVLLYTDGVTEACNPAGKEWGERALKKTFAGKGPRDLSLIRREIDRAIQSFVAGAKQKDDITFVLFEWAKPFIGADSKRDSKKAA